MLLGESFQPDSRAMRRAILTKGEGSYEAAGIHRRLGRRGVYICPNGKVLHTTGTVHEGNTLRYRASKFDCEVCALKTQCCPNRAITTNSPRRS
jgi:hypothetical protein